MDKDQWQAEVDALRRHLEASLNSAQQCINALNRLFGIAKDDE